MQASDTKAGVRLDKWLWAARFFKTRSLAAEEIARGRVLANGQVAKASREVRTGDTLALRQGTVARTVVVLGVSASRGPAPVAQALYQETAESVAAREAAARAQRADAGAGGGDRARPPDQARPPPARRLEPLERLGRQRLKRFAHPAHELAP